MGATIEDFHRIPTQVLGSIWPLLRPLVFKLNAETAHHLSMKGLDISGRLSSKEHLNPPEVAPVEVMGIRFPNRIGLAAGMDKEGAHIDGFGTFGFGFIEVGTLTPRPQPGNPKPRLFRLPKAEAIINRMGFNNAGMDAALESIQKRRYGGVLGINIGKNADTPNERALDDYLIGLRKAYLHADYIAVNLSSPNTKGLRDLQAEDSCRTLLKALIDEQKKLESQHGKKTPIAVKIAPDLEDAHIEGLAKVFLEVEIDGVIATNTTIARKPVEGLQHAEETGGLSGAPVRDRSTEVIRSFSQILENEIPLIGVGGVLNSEDALNKLEAGARLIQVYTGLVYRGPSLIHEILTMTNYQKI